MYTTLKLSPPSNTFTISSNSFSNLSKYALLFAFFVSSLYIFIPFHSFQYMRREKKKNVLSTTYSSSATPTDTSFSNLKSPSSACTPLLFRSYVQSRGVVFTVGICLFTICVQVAFLAERYVLGFWLASIYCDWVGVGPVAAFRGGYVVKTRRNISKRIVTCAVGLCFRNLLVSLLRLKRGCIA